MINTDSLTSKYEVLFSKPGKSVRLANKERMIFDFYDGRYCDIQGNLIPEEESFKAPRYNEEDSDDPWKSDWIKNEGLSEPLISESTVELEWEIDDAFGNFGFKNRAGEFVIEPQYAYAHEFTCGLAAVNFNRTWYKTSDGRRYYENHFGYINALGETVIPFAYDEAWPFNQYGVAVVEDRKRSYLIDVKGQRIPGTEKYDFKHYYDYDERYFEITLPNEDYDIDSKIGLYDTKEKKVIIEPSVDDILVQDDDTFRIYDRNGEFGCGDFHQYYINRDGKQMYPWLMGKKFAEVNIPNEHLNSIVSISQFTELFGEPSSCFQHNGKKYERRFFYGVYSSKEEFVIPPEQEKIIELSNNIYGCLKDGVITVIKVKE